MSTISSCSFPVENRHVGNVPRVFQAEAPEPRVARQMNRVARDSVDKSPDWTFGSRSPRLHGVYFVTHHNPIRTLRGPKTRSLGAVCAAPPMPERRDISNSSSGLLEENAASGGLQLANFK